MLALPTGRILFGTETAGVAVYDGETLQMLDPLLASEHITSLAGTDQDLWIGTLLFVLFGLQKLFHKYAVHRGVWHTIAAALVCSFATAIFFYYVLGRPDGVGWLAAGFMFIGYLTHLTLDEIYSVDVLGARIKKSFGTALK